MSIISIAIITVTFIFATGVFAAVWFIAYRYLQNTHAERQADTQLEHLRRLQAVMELELERLRQQALAHTERSLNDARMQFAYQIAVQRGEVDVFNQDPQGYTRLVEQEYES